MASAVPGATYRLQFHRAFTFRHAADLVPYLHALGITHVYASPIFAAVPGSRHGYDVTDPTRLNPELGTDEDFRALVARLRERAMGLILDVVPNHMAITGAWNRWWQDVLEHGPSASSARWFDIDWHPPKPDLANRVLLPVLGDQYGRVLERGEIRVALEDGRFVVAYGDDRFPVTPTSWAMLLDPVLQRLRENGAAAASVAGLEACLATLCHIPPRTATDPERIAQRRRVVEEATARLSALLDDPDIRRAVADALDTLNGRPGDPSSVDRLDALLEEQAYRLCDWRVAGDEINYRRFFDVNHLAAIRVEDPEVFDTVHALAVRLVREGAASGVRIDHPDGLRDPERYFRDLRARLPEDAYVVVEKILSHDETLRAQWAVQGTTGYEALNLLNGLFVDRRRHAAMRELYGRLTGRHSEFRDERYGGKRLVLKVSMPGELHMLARRLDRISEQRRWSRDFTLASLQEALEEVIACFPVYRTYVQVATEDVHSEGRQHIVAAIHEAKRRNPAMSESVFDFIASVLLLQDPEGLTESERAERRDFVLRFQQFTAPVMAKGLEDTAFYRAYPLASLNEVGGDPARFGVTADEFHRAMLARQAHWPAGLSATSTHDTKRSEDVRARLNVLSELPEVWEAAVLRWQSWNRGHKTSLNDHEAPDANEEYLFYQTLVGTWPLTPLDAEGWRAYRARMQAYLEKALKEAKQHTSWINPNVAYDEAVRRFVEGVLSPADDRRFLEDLSRLAGRVAHAGCLNSLSQTLLKCTTPGVPDCYQGTELWDDSLVDPDNRRAVAFAPRQAMLKAFEQIDEPLEDVVGRLLTGWRDGRIKLYVLWQALRLRREQPDLFARGAYVPLELWGRWRHHGVSFARRLERHWVLVAVPRFVTALTKPPQWPIGRFVWWDDAVILPKDAPLRWRHRLTGQTLRVVPGAAWNRLPLRRIFRHVPLGLLEAAPESLLQSR